MNYMSSKPKNNSTSVALAALVSKDNTRYFLYHDVNLIGRSENAFLCLQESYISREQCIISKTENNTFTICDKKSTSGTYVNNKKLVKNRVQPLNHKDTISFGNLQKHAYIFILNPNLHVPTDQSEYLNSQMKEKMSNLDNSHSIELMKLNRELCKIDSEKFELQQEMNSKLQDQENLFKAEKLSLSNLVSMTQEQKDNADKKLKEMKENFEAEEKRLKEEVESKYAIMAKKEEELQQLKIEMEFQHQRYKKEIKERFQAEIGELKTKLAFAELEQNRLLEETKDVQQQLAESKKILLESEIEQSRLAEEKGEVETKLFDLTKESKLKDDVVMYLKTQLEEKEKEEERMKKGVEKMEEHLMCSICVELFIEPTVLNCGHMFCKTCIEEWKTKKKVCPMCRATITNCVEVYTFDSVIETHVALLSSEAKEHREKIVKGRKEVPSKPPKRKKRRSMRASSPYRTPAEGDPYPRVIIPMVHIERLPFSGTQHAVENVPTEYNLVDDIFTWGDTDQDLRPPLADQDDRFPVVTDQYFRSPVDQDFRSPVVTMQIDDEPMQQFDHARSRTESRGRRRQSATVTSGLIDLTTP